MGLELSSGVMDRLNRIYSNEVGDAILRGVTYGLTFKTDSSKNTDYLETKQRLKDEGLKGSDVLRVYELCNGYIYDLDVRICQKLAIDSLRSVLPPDRKISQNEILALKDKPKERLKEDMKRLADKCVSEISKNNTEIEVALFSKNSTNRIQFRAIMDKSNKEVIFSYNAYCLRHTDLEELNRTYLIPKYIRISKIQPCEILPTKTGVKFKLWIERIDPSRVKIEI